MTEYALILYFDNETTTRFQSLIGIAENACSNSYMTKPAVIPPHVTICYFKTESIDMVIPLIENKISNISQGTLSWASLGAFSYSTLFATPVLNEYLLEICTVFNDLLINHVDLVDYYKPFSWMPHTTLATKLTKEHMLFEFESVISEFTPLVGTTTHLSLVRCERFSELKTWELQRGETVE
ncbi:MAG: 2'-5' RNA ligase family protein [Ruminococcus sp.]|jgi:hypothetical protein|nr:2'-5' RNA ligase family protein [Ruminococcus sp.]